MRELAARHPFLVILAACTPVFIAVLWAGIAEGRVSDGIMGGLLLHLMTAGVGILVYARRVKTASLKPNWLQLSAWEATLIFLVSWFATIAWGLTGTRFLSPILTVPVIALGLALLLSNRRKPV